MEGIAAPSAARPVVYVDTVNYRVDISSNQYNGAVPNTGLFVASNAVVGSDSGCVIYATGTANCQKFVGDGSGLTGISGGTVYAYTGYSSGTASGATTVTFSGLASSTSYRVVIRIQPADTTAGEIRLQFNSDGGATYAWGNWVRRSCATDNSGQSESTTYCRLTGNVSQTDRPVSITINELHTGYGQPKMVHAHGEMNYDDSCGTQQGSGGSFTCGYNGSATLSSLTILKSAGAFNYEVKIYKSNW